MKKLTTLAAVVALSGVTQPALATDWSWACGDGVRWDSDAVPANCWVSGSNSVKKPSTAGDNINLVHSGANDIKVEYYDTAATPFDNVRIDGLGTGWVTLSQNTYNHNFVTDDEVVGGNGLGRMDLYNGTHS